MGHIIIVPQKIQGKSQYLVVISLVPKKNTRKVIKFIHYELSQIQFMRNVSFLTNLGFQQRMVANIPQYMKFADFFWVRRILGLNYLHPFKFWICQKNELCKKKNIISKTTSTPRVHHPLDAHYHSVVDESQLS